MAHRCSNPNWGKSGPIEPATSSEFERVAGEFNLQPDEYIHSTRLREWAIRNKDSKYIPEPLLREWGLKIELTL
jgi:hypothetical protein